MYILGLGMFILLIGWFGFNAGSTLGVMDGRFAEVAMVTMLGRLRAASSARTS